MAVDILYQMSMVFKKSGAYLANVGWSPVLGACETIQVQHMGMSSVFTQGNPIFAPRIAPADWPQLYEP